MFNKAIDPKLAHPALDDIFPNIKCPEFMEDNTFLSTLRALFKNHPLSEPLTIHVPSVVPSDLGCEGPGRLYILYNCTESDMGIVNSLEGFDCSKKAENAQYYISKSGFEVSLRTNKDKKCAVIATTRKMDFRLWHILQTAIPVCLSWLSWDWLTRESLETKLLRSLTNEESDEYMGIVEEIVKEYDIDSLVRKKTIKEFAHIKAKTLLYDLRRLHGDLNGDYQAAIQNLNLLLDRLDNINRQIFEAEQRNDSDETVYLELEDYFAHHKSFEILSLNGPKLDLLCKTTFSSYDPELIQSFLNNPYSSFYTEMPEWSHDEIKKFFTAALIDCEFDIKLMAGYSVFPSGGVEARVIESEYIAEFSDYIVNPHIQNVCCLGSYSSAIVQRANEGDLMGVLDLVLQSAKSINLMDGGGMGFYRAFREAFLNDSKCITLKDGRDVTPTEALNMLKEREENTNNA